MPFDNGQQLFRTTEKPDKRSDNYIFPYLTGAEDAMKKKKLILDVTKRTNKRLKVIGSAVGVDRLTTYVARHSYATVLKRSGQT